MTKFKQSEKKDFKEKKEDFDGDLFLLFFFFFISACGQIFHVYSR